MSAKFRIGEKLYEIPITEIPENSYLTTLISRRYTPTLDPEGNYIISESPEDIPAFDAVYDFLINKKIPEFTYWPTLEFLGINPMTNYEIGLNFEERMRTAMYLPEFINHPVNRDPHFGLIRLTPELWDALQTDRPKDPNLLFADLPLVKRSWEQVMTSLNELDHLLDPNVFVAGGRVFSALFGTKSNDIDLFFHGLTTSEAEQKISTIIERMGHNAENIEEIYRLVGQLNRLNKVHEEILRKHGYLFDPMSFHRLYSANDFKDLLTIKGLYGKYKDAFEAMIKDLNAVIVPPSMLKGAYSYGGVMSQMDAKYLEEILKRSKDLPLEIIRTKNSLSLNDVQIILRLYRTPSEILHGFDVDSSAVGYDGKDIWLTQRAIYAFANGLNTVNFNRMSPSYEYRLAKYGTRGMAVRVPQFNRRNVNLQALEEKFNSELVTLYIFEGIPKKPYSNYSNLKGDSLNQVRRPPPRGLDLLLYLEYQARKRNYTPATKKAISKLAEESSDYSSKPLKSSHQEYVGNIVDYLMITADEYPQYSSRYMPLLDFAEATILRTNNIPLARRMEYISIEVKYKEVFRPSLNQVLHIPPNLYQGLAVVRPWDIPQDLQWKEIRPGEQMTGTFQQIVLKDPSVWYNGNFYHL